MPELDGFEVTSTIRHREREAGGHLPVVALTARSRSEDRDKCLSAGMDDFLTKPFRADDLWSVIERVRGLRRDANPGMANTVVTHAAFDPETILAACGENQSLLRKMCQSFQARIPTHLATIEEAMLQEDASRLREAAHKICGMLATFSADAGDVAAQLEECAGHGQFEKCRSLAERLVAMAGDLVEAVGDLSVESLQAATVVSNAARPEGLVRQTIGPMG
jgi:CheY-like chemotaxis protein